MKCDDKLCLVRKFGLTLSVFLRSNNKSQPLAYVTTLFKTRTESFIFIRTINQSLNEGVSCFTTRVDEQP